MSRRTISEEQARAIGEDYQRLIDQALQQLVEHKLWLKGAIHDFLMKGHSLLDAEAAGITTEQLDECELLLGQVNEIKLEYATQESGIKDSTNPVVEDRPPLRYSRTDPPAPSHLSATRPETVPQPTISICYEYPDELFDFLSRTDLPAGMNLASQGGIQLVDRDQDVKVAGDLITLLDPVRRGRSN